MISISFAPQIPSPIIIFFIFHAPLFTTTPEKNENMKRYAYTEMPSVRFFCGSAHCHIQVQTFYKVYIVSNFSYTKGQFTTSPPTRNVIVPYQEIESYRYIMFKNLSYHIHLYCTLRLFL